MTIRQDQAIIKLLGVNELRHFIATTSKGDLTLQLRKGETEYRLVLDAVPLDEETNDKLMKLLYPIKVQEPKKK